MCNIQLSTYLPGSTNALQYSPRAIYIPFLSFLISPPFHPHQDSGKKGFILCKENHVELKGNLTLTTTLRGHVSTGVGGCEPLFAGGHVERTGCVGVAALSTGGHHDHT